MYYNLKICWSKYAFYSWKYRHFNVFFHLCARFTIKKMFLIFLLFNVLVGISSWIEFHSKFTFISIQAILSILLLPAFPYALALRINYTILTFHLFISSFLVLFLSFSSIHNHFHSSFLTWTTYFIINIFFSFALDFISIEFETRVLLFLIKKKCYCVRKRNVVV